MELELINSNINNINNQSNFFGKMVSDVLNRGGDYLLKALPIQENIKDVLKDVKKCLENKEYNKLLKTVVNSSIREGAEFLGIDMQNIKNFDEMKDVAFKGGLREGINASIDIFTNKYVKNNLLSGEVSNYINDLKQYVNGKNFNYKLDNKINKVIKKQENVNTLFNKWHESYEKFDLNKINETFKEINKNKSIFTNEMNNKYKTVKNITEFVNNTNSKLSKLQLEVCRTI